MYYKYTYVEITPYNRPLRSIDLLRGSPLNLKTNSRPLRLVSWLKNINKNTRGFLEIIQRI